MCYALPVMLRGRCSCIISGRPTPLSFASSSLLRPLTSLFPLHLRKPPVSPLFPLLTQKQGEAGAFPPNVFAFNPFVFFDHVNYSVKYNCRRADIPILARGTNAARCAGTRQQNRGDEAKGGELYSGSAVRRLQMKPTGDSVSRIISGVPEATIDKSKRDFLRAAMALLAGLNLPRTSLAGGGLHGAGGSGQRVVLVVFGGVRRAETFSPQGLVNIPHLSADLLPQSLFYRDARNEGVTAHFNAISSILTGNWQRVDDWGKLAPTTPTLFEQFRKGLGAAQSDTWVVASNKALTNLIGASSATDYGPPYGANVVFPKQLMVAAVANALRAGRSRNMADREKIETELQSMLEAGNYEGLGWSVFDGAERLDPRVRGIIDGGHHVLCAQRRPHFGRRTDVPGEPRGHAEIFTAPSGGYLFGCGSGALRFLRDARWRHTERRPALPIRCGRKYKQTPNIRARPHWW